MPTSYPVEDGRIQAPGCEVNIVEHCNLSCRSCSHLSPVLPKRSVEVDAIHRDLALLGRSYHARWIRLLGGEPLLHPALLEVIEAVRRAAVADSVCVVTNGLLLPRMPPDFWQAVDKVQVSLYPGRELGPEQLRACRRRAEAGGTTIELRPYDQFRPSYSELGTGDFGLVRAIYDSCRVVHDWRCHTVADGRFYKCPQSYFLPKVVDGCGANQIRDSIAITDSETFRYDLLAFLNSSDPLASCGHCLGTAGRRFPQAQVRRVEFRSLQQRSAEELVDPTLLSPLPSVRFSARLRSLLGKAARSGRAS